MYYRQTHTYVYIYIRYLVDIFGSYTYFVYEIYIHTSPHSIY